VVFANSTFPPPERERVACQQALENLRIDVRLNEALEGLVDLREFFGATLGAIRRQGSTSDCRHKEIGTCARGEAQCVEHPLERPAVHIGIVLVINDFQSFSAQRREFLHAGLQLMALPTKIRDPPRCRTLPSFISAPN
jgi:hypothetical protein